MNLSKVPDAKQNNNKLFPPYAKRLQSDDLNNYSAFAHRFAMWLKDGRAYYKEARPEIVKILKIAQATLRRNASADMDENVSFHISNCINHPMVAPYSELLKAMHPHKDRFVEADLYAEIQTLLRTITALPPPLTHIDLTAEPNSPLEILTHENSATQQGALLSAGPFIFSSHSLSAPSFPRTQGSPATSNNALNVEYSAESSSLPTNSHPVPPKNPSPPHHPSLNDGQNISPSSQTINLPLQEPVFLKPKKKKKKKSALGLESLIELDIQDLQKRADPIVEVEATDIPVLLPGSTSYSSPHPEVIVIYDDEPAKNVSQAAASRTLSAWGNETPMLVDQSLHRNEATSLSAISSEPYSIDPNPNPVVQEPADIVMADGIEREVTHSTSMSGVKVAVKTSIDDSGPDSMTQMAGIVFTNAISAPFEAMEVEKPDSAANGEPVQEPLVSNQPHSTIMHALPDRPLVETRSTDDSNQIPMSGLAVASPITGTSPPSFVNVVSLPPVVQNVFLPASPVVNTTQSLPSPPRPGTPAESTPLGSMRHETVNAMSIQQPSSNTLVSVNSEGSKLDRNHAGLTPEVNACTAEELRALHAFGPEMRVLRVQNGESKETPKLTFDISCEDFDAIKRWNNRRNPVEDVSSSFCVSLAGYSRISASPELKSISELSEMPITWPTGDTLRMDVMYKGHQRATLPLSPPFLIGPNGLVDVSEHMCLGENAIGFKQFGDMRAHIFVLRIHRPTGAQLQELARRQQKDREWSDFQLRMAQPFEITIPLNSSPPSMPA